MTTLGKDLAAVMDFIRSRDSFAVLADEDTIEFLDSLVELITADCCAVEQALDR